MKAGTRIRLYKSVGLITSPPSEVVFSPEQPQPRRLLFIFPLQRKPFMESRPTFRRLSGFLQRNVIDLAVANIFRDELNDSRRSIFYFPMVQEEPPILRLDVLLARYRNESFDAVINMEPELNVQLARVISVIETPRRIGFAGPYADSLYNIQIHPRSGDRLRKSYSQMLELCDLDPTDA